MHELSLAVEVVHIVEQAVRQHGLQVVDRLRLTVGELACVEIQALETALVSALAGTAAAQAQLEFIDEPGAGICQACQAQVAVHELHAECAACGSGPVRVTRGQALKVSAIEGY